MSLKHLGVREEMLSKRYFVLIERKRKRGKGTTSDVFALEETLVEERSENSSGVFFALYLVTPTIVPKRGYKIHTLKVEIREEE